MATARSAQTPISVMRTTTAWHVEFGEL